MTSTHAFWLAGRQATGEDSFDVTNSWDGRLVGTVILAAEGGLGVGVGAGVGVGGVVGGAGARVR
ncbi:aldehyde dehydrogenase, partial [Streptomyces sp. NPDC059744]